MSLAINIIVVVCIRHMEMAAMRRYKIPRIPPTTTKSVRFPNDVIEEVEAAIRGKECTFTAFVLEAVRVALDNLREEAENR